MIHKIQAARHILKTIYPSLEKKNNYRYVKVRDKNLTIVEPDNIAAMPVIQEKLGTRVILFKTISSFKGLERDVIFLVIPNIKKFKQNNTKERFDNFMKQLYRCLKSKIQIIFL